MTRTLAIVTGFILITLSPVIFWLGEAGKTAVEFRSAIAVNAKNWQDRYVRLQARAEVEESLACPDLVDITAQDCLYVDHEVREYNPQQGEVCSNTKPEGKIIKQLPEPRCSENGANCQTCYLVENRGWQQLKAETQFARFKLGDYHVLADGSAKVVGAKVHTRYYRNAQYDSNNFTLLTPESYPVGEKVLNKPLAGDLEVTYRYIETGTELLVAGEALKGEIKPAGKQLIISTLAYEPTLNTLARQDPGSNWPLRLLSLLVLLLGFVLIGTAVTSPKPTIVAAGASLGVIAWTILLGLVMVLESIAAVGIFLALLFLASLTLLLPKRDLEMAQ